MSEIRIISKKIDNKYMDFLSAYFEMLTQYETLSSDRIVTMVTHYYMPIIYRYLRSKEIPIEFKDVRYSVVDGSQAILPPGCIWISRTGRYSAHDLSYITETQGYVLWDLVRKVHSPKVFHDLVGLNEESSEVFCRTLDNSHFGDYNSPLLLNLEWIEVAHFINSDAGYICSRMKEFEDDDQFRDYTQSQIVRYRVDEFDLSRVAPVPSTKTIVEIVIEKLGSVELVKAEELFLIGSILNVPDILYGEVTFIDSVREVTNDEEVIDKLLTLKEEFEENKRNTHIELPF